MLTVGSLFAGIGGFDLGLERAGMKVIWQSEIDPYASAVLKKHWPEVPNHGDIRSISAAGLRDYDRNKAATSILPNPNQGRCVESFDSRISGTGVEEKQFARNSSFPDVLCGGFPCQDISNAGKRAGIDGERSGLWSEYARVIGELRPRYVIVENVSALLGRGLERVLGDLAALGFDAEWHCIPASAVGAPHRRDRVWIIAHARGEQHEGAGIAKRRAPTEGLSEGVADADQPRLEGRLRASLRECADQRAVGVGGALENAGCVCAWRGAGRGQEEGRWPFGESTGPGWWRTEPDVGRVAHGVPKRVDRLRCLGNAIVPQIAEIIGRAIVSQHDPRV